MVIIEMGYKLEVLMHKDEKIWELLLELQSNGSFDFYFVGGCVRDLCYGIHSCDIDIVFKGNTEELFELLRGKWSVRKSNLSTLSIRGDSFDFDFASPRKDEYPRSNGIPRIELASIEEDLIRRDFTVNTGYLQVSVETIRWIKGEMPDVKQIMSKIQYAHPMFESDITEKKLRILNVKSFEEDPSRLIRAIKYMVILNLSLENESKKIFQKAIEDRRIVQLDKTRYLRIIWDYFQHYHSKELMLKLDETGLLISQYKYMELLDQVDNLKLKWKCPQLDSNIIVYVVMFYNLREQMKTIGHIINSTVKETEFIQLKLEEMNRDSIVKKRYLTYKILYNKSIESIACANLLCDGSEWIHLYMIDLKHIKLHLTGEDLKSIGINEGPSIGKFLEALLMYKLNDNPSLDFDGEIRWIESAKNEIGN